jgi:hypothetical protein
MPPENLHPRQVLIFNGIRYSIDICEFAFQRLKENLYKFSFSEKEFNPGIPIIFSVVWTIINNTTIFYNIVSRHFNINKGEAIFGKIRGIEFFRHSQQHIDERIDEILLEKELPIYGSLSWYAQMEPDSIDGKIVTIYSGTITGGKSISSRAVNPAGKINNKEINGIEFTMVVKIKKQYEVRTIEVNELMTDLEVIIDHLDAQITEQLIEYEPMKKHVNDLIVTIKVKKS